MRYLAANIFLRYLAQDNPQDLRIATVICPRRTLTLGWSSPRACRG